MDGEGGTGEGGRWGAPATGGAGWGGIGWGKGGGACEKGERGGGGLGGRRGGGRWGRRREGEREGDDGERGAGAATGGEEGGGAGEKRGQEGGVATGKGGSWGGLRAGGRWGAPATGRGPGGATLGLKVGAGDGDGGGGDGDVGGGKEYIEIPRIFKEFAKVRAPDPIRIPRIGVAGRENESMTLELSFLEDHKPWEKKGADILLGILIDETSIELQEYVVDKIRNFSDVLKDKKHLQNFLGVVNFAGIFIKDLVKYRKDFLPLLREIESLKEMGGNSHVKGSGAETVSNLPKLAIPQDDDELLIYTNANDFRWVALLMKKTNTGEEACRYARGLFPNNKHKCGTSTRKNYLRFGRLLRNSLYFYLLKNSL
ncbi:hypothetical protein Sango_0644600 [Sesamum angolense]|uniref:Uncharacterized protein n=1 Tax=Sesamum angolense TaxID=2727404 RepID=A0AAE1X776_9LAMI|nr:hypothetical protein Sango_0644600 [Sesamum angolense]